MTERTQFTAWITKYALTEGILEMQVEDCFDISPSMIKIIGGPKQFFHGQDWHLSRELAVAHAKKMQSDKLKSLDKQRARVAALKF